MWTLMFVFSHEGGFLALRPEGLCVWAEVWSLLSLTRDLCLVISDLCVLLPDVFVRGEGQSVWAHLVMKGPDQSKGGEVVDMGGTAQHHPDARDPIYIQLCTTDTPPHPSGLSQSWQNWRNFLGCEHINKEACHTQRGVGVWEPGTCLDTPTPTPTHPLIYIQLF